MKRIILFLLGCLTVCVILAGCSEKLTLDQAQLDMTVGTSVCLEALKDLLTVMQAHSGGRKGDIAVGNDAGIMPALAGIIVHHKHMVGKDMAESQLGLVLRLSLRGLGKL